MTSAFSGLSAGCAGGSGASTRSSAGGCGAVEPLRVTVGSVIGHSEDPLRLLRDLGDPERLAADPVVALRVDQELGPDQHQELAEVDLRDQDPAIAAKNLLRIRGEGVEMPEMG